MNRKNGLILFSLVCLGLLNSNLEAIEQSKDFFYKMKSGENSKIEEKSRNNPLSNLKHFLNNDLILGESCPNDVFEKNIDYLRYLFRLLSLSYLYESLNDYQEQSKLLKLQASNCQINWQTALSACQAKTKEMQKFKGRAIDFINKNQPKNYNRPSIYNPFNQSISKLRILPIMRLNEFNKLPKNQKTRVFNQICQEDIRLFKTICSETDKIFGLSKSSNFIEILSESHSYRQFNKDGKGEGCLERFVHFYQHQESYPPHLPKLFYSVEKKLINDQKDQYREGSLYLSGSLREFDEKNLVDFLYTKGKIEKKPMAKKIAKVPNFKPKKRVVPLKKEKPLPIRPQQKKPPAIKKLPKVSAFETAYQKFLKTGRQRTKVQMRQFITEFPLSSLVLARILPTIKEYSSQEALTEMKEFDHLGTKKTPLSLLFLKILLMEKDYHRLFNISRILGKNIYVINDLDDKKGAIPIEFIYDKGPKKWKIFISVPNKKK